MKKLLKSKKALSPVVAAIILIAVTVAVSIAVAAWMGSLTFTFMETEQLTITKITFAFAGAAQDGLNVTIMNTGTTDVVITGVTVSGSGVTDSDLLEDSYTILKGSTNDGIDINLTGAYVNGTAYNVELLSSKGNKFTYTDTAPS